MAVVGNLSPLLFLTFRSLYGISYSLLGALVVVFFGTQLLIDLVFSFFSHKFNIAQTVRLTPILTALGMLLYAGAPLLFPDAVYVGLVLGTVVFAASAGLAEVLISPVFAALPAKNPEREMSKLHSVYAWGVVGAVILSTLFLLVLGYHRWQLLALLWMAVPLTAAVLFAKAEIPHLETPASGNVWSLVRQKDCLLCVLCIFLGGASECTMAQWSSSYLEKVLSIPKVWGDVFGVAMFAVMLGLGRSLYAKAGRRIFWVLIGGSAGALGCYLVAAVCDRPLVGLVACALTGLCVAMLWPGSLTVAAARFPSSGVAIFALMAAGGDLGGSVGPQLVGVITDAVIASPRWMQLASTWGLSAEQLGMKAGLVAAAVFPLLAIVLFCWVARRSQKGVFCEKK